MTLRKSVLRGTKTGGTAEMLLVLCVAEQFAEQFCFCVNTFLITFIFSKFSFTLTPACIAASKHRYCFRCSAEHIDTVLTVLQKTKQKMSVFKFCNYVFTIVEHVQNFTSSCSLKFLSRCSARRSTKIWEVFFFFLNLILFNFTIIFFWTSAEHPRNRFAGAGV